MNKINYIIIATMVVALLGCTKFKELSSSSNALSFVNPTYKYLPADYVAVAITGGIDYTTLVKQNSVYGNVRSLNTNTVWDENGNLITLTGTSYTYDATGKLEKIGNSAVSYNSKGYLKLGNLTYSLDSTQILSDGTNTFTYNTDGTITSGNFNYTLTNGRVTQKLPIGLVAGVLTAIKDSFYYVYSYDGNGNVSKYEQIVSDNIYKRDTASATLLAIPQNLRTRTTITYTYTGFNQVASENHKDSYMTFYNDDKGIKQHYEVVKTYDKYYTYILDAQQKNWVSSTSISTPTITTPASADPRFVNVTDNSYPNFQNTAPPIPTPATSRSMIYYK